MQERGYNVLTTPKRASMWKLYLEKYRDPMIRILLVAAIVSLGLATLDGEYVESIGIFLAVLLATTVGFLFERDAARRFNVLTAIGEETMVKVVIDGRVVEMARKDIVVGDLVVLAVGDEIPADGELTECTDLQIDESALTGEPLAYKSLSTENEGAYPPNVVLRGTMVMNGNGRMRVTAIGDSTEIGKVARKATEPIALKTPLNMQLDRLAGVISRVGIGIAVAAFICFLLNDIMTNDAVWKEGNYVEMARHVLEYFMMSVTLIVMVVPEGLPMAVTLALALNMRRMLRTNNLVRKLHVCETMGAVTVICTDKTGTLTQNRMRVYEISEERKEQREELETAIAVNSTAELDGNKTIGNPTEAALLLWLKDNGVDYRELRNGHTVEWQLPFSTEHKFMVTMADGALYVKGAPERVMAFCGEGIWTKHEELLRSYQNKAMRTLAFAVARNVKVGKEHIKEALEEGRVELSYQGMAAISDPLREEVPAAVRSCRDAGISVKIVTGDTSATAIEIARQIGIWGEYTPEEAQITGAEWEALSDEEAEERASKIIVMSRARPTDKQRLVDLLQKRGEVVAVTGDGTNDAPALNHAHVGLSLGSGTSVAKNASDMTIIDDSFGSIVKAVEWGRSLYRNIQRFVFFQLVVNVAALLLVLGGSVIGTELPLTIMQMLWINLIMDTFAATALSTLPPESDVMREKPRKQTDFIINHHMAWWIGVVGVGVAIVMMIMLYHFEHDQVRGVDPWELTIFFTVFVMIQWWNLLNAKALGTNKSALSRLAKDKGLLMVMLIILIGQILIVRFGGEIFRTQPLSPTIWLWIIVGTSPVIWIGEAFRKLRIKR